MKLYPNDFIGKLIYWFTVFFLLMCVVFTYFGRVLHPDIYKPNEYTFLMNFLVVLGSGFIVVVLITIMSSIIYFTIRSSR